MSRKSRCLPQIQSSASESYKDPDPLGTVNLRPSIANSHVQDLVAKKWDKEKAKTFQPYNDLKFNRVFKLPSNEVSFMGGLGETRGNLRSQTHVERPNAVQKIFKMRTGNRSLFTLTEDPHKTSTVVHRFPTRGPKDVKAIVDKVWMANNFDDSKKSSESDSVVARPRRFQKKVEPVTETRTSFQVVDNIRSRLDDLFKVPNELLEPRETFLEWAVKERERFKQRRLQMTEKQERNVTETLSIPEDESTDSLTTCDRSRVPRIRKREVIRHIAGYQYGQFTKIPKKDAKNTKFGIPVTMIERVKEENKRKEEKNSKLRKARISHMKLPIFFDEDNSDEDDVVETVKALTLVRTPFLRLPKIKTQQRRRRDRLRSKYLKQDRLNRITMLLYNRSDGPQISPRSFVDRFAEQEHEVEAKQEVDTSSFVPQRRKFVAFIREMFREQIKNYVKDQADEMTFEQFKETEKLNVNFSKSSPSLASVENAREQDETLPVPKTRKSTRFDRSDATTGPFYIDPDKMEKANDPQFFKKLPKYYTSLMRGRFDTRDRLQVIGRDFEDESCGPHEYSHRLMTEYDHFYIHELSYRKSIRKFCPKTDILNIRASVRKKFIDYFIQENLQELIRKQTEEKMYLDEIDKFSTICEPLFQKKKFEYFQHMNQQIASLAPTLKLTQDLEKDKEAVLAELEVVNDKLIKVEILFAHYLVYMNFYKRMLPPEWKMDNMELFKEFEKSLEFLTNTSKKLKERDPEFVAHGDEEMEAYDLQLPEASTELLEAGIRSVKFRVKELLFELVQIMWGADKITQEHNQFKTEFPKIENASKKNVLFEDKKLSFVEERNYVLKYDVEQIAKKSLAKCVKNPVIRKISAICDQLYKSAIPPHLQNRNQSSEPVLDKFAFIQDYVLDLLHELDEMPPEIVQQATKEVKVQHNFLAKQATSCVQQQNRFEMMKKQLKFHFSKPKGKSRKRRSPSPGKKA